MPAPGFAWTAASRSTRPRPHAPAITTLHVPHGASASTASARSESCVLVAPSAERQFDAAQQAASRRTTAGELSELRPAVQRAALLRLLRHAPRRDGRSGRSARIAARRSPTGSICSARGAASASDSASPSTRRQRFRRRARARDSGPKLSLLGETGRAGTRLHARARRRGHRPRRRRHSVRGRPLHVAAARAPRAARRAAAGCATLGSRNGTLAVHRRADQARAGRPRARRRADCFASGDSAIPDRIFPRPIRRGAWVRRCRRSTSR